MAMASLLEAAERDAKKDFSDAPSYLINTRDLGLDPGNAGSYQNDLQELKDTLESYFQKEKIYFKFLYAMADKNSNGLEPGAIASLDNCMSEYITGYARVSKVELAPLNGSTEQHIKITLDGTNNGQNNGQKRMNVPLQACYDYYTTQRFGKWSGSDCEGDIERKYDELFNRPGKIDDLVNGNMLTSVMVAPLMLDMEERLAQISKYDIPSQNEVGTHLNKDLSYLKLPMSKAKRGGGIRVKRLLIYDPGMNTADGEAALYGQEYLYQDYKTIKGQRRVISSGVATTEPADAREENPLVTFLPRKGQSWYSRITAGEDKEQTEGPLGESLLPAASVGHSRVVVKNIHQGPTGTGFTVHSFHTVKDHPFDKVYKGGDANSFDFSTHTAGVDYSSLSDNQVKDFLIIPAGLFYYELNKVWAAQAYRFIINNMHGQIRQVTTYAGDYSADMDKCQRVAEQTYDYYQPGEKVKMLQADGTYQMEIPGKEMDVAMEMKSVSENTMDLEVEVDITIGIAPPIPIIPGAGLSFSYTDKGISTHVISKVIRYPTLIKSVTAFQDGVNSRTENLAFNPHTGQVLLTRTTDGFDKVTGKLDQAMDGNIYALSLPASWYYPQMGRKSENSTYSNQLSAMAGNIVSYGKDGNPLRIGKDVSSNNFTWTNSPIKDVINASVQTYRNDYFADSSATALAILSEYAGKNLTVPETDALQLLLQTKWHPWTSYVYREDVLSANATGKGIYNGGLISDFNFFTFWQTKPRDLPLATKWMATNEVNYYSPHGNALQERNALGIYSAAKFGYGYMMPVMVGSNCQYQTLNFEDYENQPSSTFIKIDVENAHSGSHYLELSQGEKILLADLKVNGQLKNTGGLIKLWAKTNGTIYLSLKDGVNNPLPNGNQISLSPIAQTGKWTLYQAIIAKEVFNDPSVSLNSSFNIHLNVASGNAWVDDVRFQPKDAQATCYVYDVKTLRLLTQFDDQHFGLYYQYNGEGKLVAKQIETERGLKTIQETQYNTPGQERK